MQFLLPSVCHLESYFRQLYDNNSSDLFMVLKEKVCPIFYNQKGYEHIFAILSKVVNIVRLLHNAHIFCLLELSKYAVNDHAF